MSKRQKTRQKYKRRREDILSLRRAGLSFKQIRAELGCSMSTISYHCGANKSEKKRVKAQEASPLSRKVGRFKARCTKQSWRNFRLKVKSFKKKQKGVGKARTDWRVHNVSKPYNCNDVVKKIGDNPVCYLTGRKIDLF